MNVKSVALTSIILMSLVALYGCGPDDDTATGSPLITGPLAELQGTWIKRDPVTKSHCIRETSVTNNSKTFFVVTSYRISNNSISASKTYYSGTDYSCSGASQFIQESSYSNLTVKDNATSSGGFKEYNATYLVESHGITPNEPNVTADFISLSECGIKTWVTSEYTSLLNNICGNSKNITLLNSYRVIGTNLYLGNPLDEAESDDYPPINDQILYIKQ